MAGPTIQNIASQAGTLQSVVSPKRTDETKKDTEARHLPAGGDDDEDSKKTGGAGKSGGTGKASGAQTGQEGKRVRRKKVSLDQIASKQTEKTSKKEGTSQVGRPTEAQETEKAQQAKSDAADTKALGYAKAAGKLNEQSRLTQASVQHEQAQKDNPQPELSAAGRKRGMLSNLVNWTGINHAQHTGDKAGEAYNRRGAREAHMALKGLFNGNQSGSTSTTSGSSTTDRLAAKGVKYDQHKLETVQRFHAEEQPPEAGYEAFEATG